MASDCIDAALQEPTDQPVIERALQEPTDVLWVENVEFVDTGSDLDEEELDKLQMDGKSENTTKQTAWGVNAFTGWATRRNIIIDFATINSNDLAKTLRKFYAEYRTKKGELPTPSTLRSLKAAVHRTLRDPPYSRSVTIMTDKEFTSANSMFESRCKAYFVHGGKSLKHKPCIEKGDLDKLSEYFGDLDNTDPTRMLEMVWFNLCFYLGRRGREGWRGFTKTTLELRCDDNNKCYLTFTSAEKTKNWQGGSTSDHYCSDVRIHENESTTDPVSVYIFYLSKLHPDCDASFQIPRKCFEKSGCWYNNARMGKNSLGTIMQSISRKLGLSQVYTCHSVRVSTITYLYHAGVDTKQICNITKHKSEESLKHYISGSSSAQKRASSEILHGVMSQKKPASSVDLRTSYSDSVVEHQASLEQHVGFSYGSFDLGLNVRDIFGASASRVPVSRFGGSMNLLAGENINNLQLITM